MALKVQILDHTENMEKTIAAAAKLCYSGAEIDDLLKDLTEEKIERFVSMLESYGHESPFEHCSITFAIEGVSRILEQQLTRHRLASYSIQSGRYVNRSNASFYVPPSIAVDVQANEIYMEAIEVSKKAYEDITTLLITKKINEFLLDKEPVTDDNVLLLVKFKEKYPKEYSAFEKKAVENARCIFPNSLETKIIVTMNIRSLWNFFKHRCCNRAQEEIKELARIMLRLCKELSPVLFAHSGPACIAGLGCPENAMQCEELKGKVITQAEVKEIIKNLKR